MMAYDAVLAGAGESQYHKKAQQPLLGYLAEAGRRALHSCGLGISDVDGLAVTSFQLSPDNVVTLAEHVGLQVSWAWQGVHGGASAIVGLLEAVAAIRRGDARVVLCVAGDAFDVASHMEMLDHSFNAAMRDYLAPYGFGGTNGLFALVEQRHRHEFGTSREQLAKLAVTQRSNAVLNPNALLRDPLTVNDYLTARMISSPLRLYDCVLPCAGADAVIVCAANAVADDVPTVRVLSGGQTHNWDPDPSNVIMLDGGWPYFGDEMFADAGVTRDEVDFLELYDDYPIMEVIQLEGLGFCGRGAGGRFIEATDISLSGRLPINTGGGQLSCGQAGAGGGMIGLVEAVWQLQGRAGKRQLRRARTGVVSGFGMVGYGRGLSCSAAVLSTDR